MTHVPIVEYARLHVLISDGIQMRDLQGFSQRTEARNMTVTSRKVRLFVQPAWGTLYGVEG
jgi:hypothetical protein